MVKIIEALKTVLLDSRIQPNMPVPFMSSGYHPGHIPCAGYPHLQMPIPGIYLYMPKIKPRDREEHDRTKDDAKNCFYGID